MVLSAVILLSMAAQAAPTPADVGLSVAPLVERVKGSVVTIQSTKVIPRVVSADPMAQFFRNVRPRPRPPGTPRDQTRLGLGIRASTSPAWS